nr:PREDICTED: heparan-alpha-glucosaminide N-acetyltransferase-like [Latimeria chalumnae]|eukprot:XP_014352684.1 PREDICTED: heparan-alpha-glucosaminide N-acetyltransferase-like [Latimeria chalumnae]
MKNPTEECKQIEMQRFAMLLLTIMVFVNYGGGGYWFFEHVPWNGLTVADVMPWFVFIIGTSVALAFNAMLRRGVKRVQLLHKLTWRSLVLILIGVFFINYGPADGLVVELGSHPWGSAATWVHLFHCGSDADLWAPVRDIFLYWPEWIVVVLLETLWLCVTYRLPVPGCPKGYIGPGGIGDDGKYPNCTGGAAAYIDTWLLGANHIYQHPTCKELYQTTVPFDPEGVLGTINSIVMASFGLQAGKIVIIFRQKPLDILKRFLIWTVILGLISAILTKCTRDEGFMPINKNLWSLSFITTMGCFSFFLLGVLFFIIDVRDWWGGRPFIFPGKLVSPAVWSLLSCRDPA